MAGKFEAEIQQAEGLTHVRLSGTLDEDNELLPLAGHIRGTAVIDLSGIREINNCGVRDWVRWLDEVQAKSATVVLTQCSPAIVAQLNQVSNFAGKAYVKSFYVPFFCQTCDQEKAVLVEMAEFDGRDVGPPTCRCDTCDGVMVFDDLEESYFAFVKEVRRRVPDPVVDQIEELEPQSGDRKFLSPIEGTGAFTHAASGAGLQSASAGAYRTFAGSASVLSAGALRRLRERSGVRTKRATAAVDSPGQGSRARLLLIGGAVLVAAVAVVLLVVLL